MTDLRKRPAEGTLQQRVYRALRRASMAADLIAAAPDMYAALSSIATADPSKWEADVRDQFREWAQNVARAALSKASHD